MKIVIIDNYDSFTYNLSHLVKEMGADVAVYRNDQFEMSWLEEFDKIILSPGPGIPSEAGQLLDVIKTYAGRKPILGVCLGHQAIGEYFGAKLENLSDVFHGVATKGTIIKPDPLFANVGSFTTSTPTGDLGMGDINKTSTLGMGDINKTSTLKGGFGGLLMGRYHSWVVSRENFPDCLEITVESEEGQIMALRHKTLDIHGIQFHPESVLTPDGKTIIGNWLRCR